MLASAPHPSPASNRLAALKGFNRRVCLCNRELHALVAPDSAPEDLTLGCVRRRSIDEVVPVAHGFGRDEDPFRVPAIDDVAETLPLFAHEIMGGNAGLVEKHGVRVVVEHHRDAFPLDRITSRSQVDEEHRQAIGPILDLVDRSRPGQQEHEIGELDSRDEDLLAGDHVLVPVANRAGPELGRVGARVGLGDSERLEAEAAGCDLR